MCIELRVMRVSYGNWGFCFWIFFVGAHIISFLSSSEYRDTKISFPSKKNSYAPELS